MNFTIVDDHGKAHNANKHVKIMGKIIICETDYQEDMNQLFDQILMHYGSQLESIANDSSGKKYIFHLR